MQSYAVVAVVVLLLAAGLLYFDSVRPNLSGSTTTTETNQYSSSISSLQNEIGSLQLANQALQAELAALSAHANSSAGPSAARIYSQAKTSVVTVQGGLLTVINTIFGPFTSVSSILGSGFVISYKNSSFVVTNFHVVDGVSNLTVTFSDGNSYPATVAGSDANSDMAVLYLGSAPSNEFVPLALATHAQEAAVGDSVYAIGNPFGLSGSMTYGIVSQTGRTISESTSNVSIPDIIQFSAPINPGNSGGPLLDSNGVVVGMTTAAVTNSQGLGFAIPSDTILRELPSLVAGGSYHLHPYLGIAGADMSYELALVSKTNVTYGILVEQVASGSPAADAGIRAGSRTVVIGGADYLVGGDIIVTVNGTKVLNQDSLAAYLEENATAGQKIQVGLIRSGTLTTATVTLGSLPGQ